MELQCHIFTPTAERDATTTDDDDDEEEDSGHNETKQPMQEASASAELLAQLQLHFLSITAFLELRKPREAVTSF